MRAGNGLSIGKLAEQSGVNIETIRYYEKGRCHAGAGSHRRRVPCLSA
jgi:predicted transcriptional regulator